LYGGWDTLNLEVVWANLPENMFNIVLSGQINLIINGWPQ
jgi:hypothetical protein